jgi:zinc D-Ala-D-Ala carboxypeptidase
MDNISDHITFKEATYTSKKLPNIPSAKELEAMKLVALLCFEPMRKWYGKPLKVNSFFRSKEVNKAVGGASTSQHLFGEAIDLTTGSIEDNVKLFEWAKSNLTYDQIILENNGVWVHISYRSGRNRQQVLRINK